MTPIPINSVGGGSIAFDALIYPEQHPGTVNYFSNNMARLTEYAGNVSDSFIQLTKDTYNAFNNSTIVNIAKNALNTAKGILRPETIVRLDMDSLTSAGLGMQRWIMANPEVRTLYHNQMCDGFSATYVDNHPEAIGSDHYDYRRVTHGAVLDDAESDRWIINFYTEELDDDSDELSVLDRLDIMSTWDSVANVIAKGLDPTDPEGGEL